MIIEVDPYAAQWVARLIVDGWTRAGMRWNGDSSLPKPTQHGRHPDTARKYVARALLRGVRYLRNERGIDVPTSMVVVMVAR